MNVKPGDLAIIINSTIEANIGRVVRVISFSGSIAFGPGDDNWLCEMAGAPARNTLGFVTPAAHVRDRNLRPISGLPVEEYDRLTEKEPA